MKKYLLDSKSTNENINKPLRFLKDQFLSLDWLKGKSVPLIGIGGSARNLAQIHQNITEYPLAGLHQYALTGKDIEQMCTYLVSFSENELKNVEGLSKDRSDTILPASLVFLTLYETIQAESFVLSRKGLRDGVFYEQLATDSETNLYPNVLEDSILELVYEYNLNLKQIEHITSMTKKFFDQLIDIGIGGLHPNDWTDLKRGCYVYNLGKYIDSESSSQHTFYLLANRTIDGLMHIDRLKMALLGSYKNKTIFRQYMAPHTEWFTEREQDRLRTLGSILKLAYCLDATKRQVVEDFEWKSDKENIYMKIYCNQDFLPEQYQTEKQKKQLERALGRNIHLQFICQKNKTLK